MTIEMPRSRDEILAALDRVHAESARYWTSFSTPTFFAPIESAWSPADNIRHLNKSIRAVTRGLQKRRFVLRLLFGRPQEASRPYDQLRDDYHRALEQGGQAGTFAPTLRGFPANAEAERARILRAHAANVCDIDDAARAWPDALLDQYRLPHPLLGKLTIREMLFLTLYHSQHHVDVVRRRLAQKH